MKRSTGLLALWCIAMLVLMFVRPNFSNASKPQNGISDPVLSLQMAHSVIDVDAVLGDAPSLDREVMRTKQYEDFGFIAGYAGLYLGLSLLLINAHPRFRILAIIGAIAGIGAAVFDVWENFAILRIVDLRLAETTQPMIDALHRDALIKWGLGFIALGLLSTYFLRDRRWTARIVGGIDAAAALLGLVSLMSHTLLVPAAGLIGLGLIGAAIVLLLIP
jgi:hypothetical protein